MADPETPTASPDPIEALEKRIAELDEKIAPLAAELETLEEERGRHVHALSILHGLTGSKGTVNVKPMLHKSRVRHSGGRSDSKLVQAANLADKTLDELADEVGCSTALLSAASHGKKSISMEWAKKVEEILGVHTEGKNKGKPRYPATLASWPMLRSE